MLAFFHIGVVRRSTAVTDSRGAPPDHEHDHQDGAELQQNSKAHQPLGGMRAAAAQHVEQTEQEHHRDGGDRNKNKRV
jgi:hypothetical protein